MNEPQPKASRPKGTGCVFLRGDTWWLKYSHHGHVYRESTKKTDKTKAEKMLRTRLAELTTGSFIGPKTERIRVEELADDLLRDYRINSKKSLDDVTARWTLHLKPFFGDQRAVDVTSTKVNEYVDARQKESAANATINRELAALKRMFNLGRKSTPPKVLRVPAFPHLAEHNIRQGFLESAQYHKLTASCSELWFRALLEVAHTYGWRISELITMRVNQIDLAQRSIRLEPGTTKNQEGRETIMTDAVNILLTACVHGKPPNGFVFTRSNGEPVRDFRGKWRAACTKAGVPELLFHDLRRTAVRNLVNAGVPERVAMKISGHKTRSVFDRYHIVSKADVTAAVLKLQGSQTAQVQSESAPPEQNGHKNGHNPVLAAGVAPAAVMRTDN